MYDNNDNYSQQSGSQSSNNNGYPEYYYSQNIPNGNYQQTVNASPVPLLAKRRIRAVLARRRPLSSVSVWCSG